MFDVTFLVHVPGGCSVPWTWILVTRRPLGGHEGRLGMITALDLLAEIHLSTTQCHQISS